MQSVHAISCATQPPACASSGTCDCLQRHLLCCQHHIRMHATPVTSTGCITYAHKARTRLLDPFKHMRVGMHMWPRCTFARIPTWQQTLPRRAHVSHCSNRHGMAWYGTDSPNEGPCVHGCARACTVHFASRSCCRCHLSRRCCYSWVPA